MIDDNEIKRQVEELLLSNINQGYSKLLGKNFCYIKPSRDMYPFQYFWDTAFHVFILTRLGQYDWAKKNIESLLAMQEENGFVGHMIFWNEVLPTRLLDVLQARPTLGQIRPHMSALIQPTFIAQAVLRIYEGTSDTEFVKKMLPKIKKYFNWLSGNRDFDNDGLISIISPYESGIDWKPSLDPVMKFRGQANRELAIKNHIVDFKNFIRRYDLSSIYKKQHFAVKEVGYNSIYILDLYALEQLCRIAGDASGQEYAIKAKKATGRMMEIMYDDEDKAFYDVYGRDNKKLEILTPTIFFPIRLPGIDSNISKGIIEKHLLNKDEFDLPFPIPSVAKNDLAFNPNESLYIWRGPTWVVYNWFLFHCLLSLGYYPTAEKLKITVKELIDKSGFREYYNPLTGEGYGEKNFTWSGLIIDMESNE